MRVAAVPSGSLSLLDWLPYLWKRVAFPAAPPADARVRWRSLAVVFVLPALLLYPVLGFYLFEPDEGRAVRARRLDECLDIYAGLMAGQPFSYTGTHFSCTSRAFRPRWAATAAT